MLRVDRLQKRFDDGFLALGGVSLAVERGEIVSLVGTSGCGKSTLLRIVGGLDHPTLGEVRIDGETVKDRLGWVTSPDTRASLRNTWSLGGFTANWNVNYIGDQENPGTVPAFGFLAGGANTRIGSYTTHDLSASYEMPWSATVTLGVNNAGDKYPELVGYDNRPWNFYLYDAYGRTVYFRYAQKF